MLNILENFPLAEMGPESADALHIMAESMKFAYADRSKYLGDPDFVEVPTDLLVSELRQENCIENFWEHALDSNEIAPGDLSIYESDETTHYSVIDDEGNIVGNTYTLMLHLLEWSSYRRNWHLMNNNMGNFTLRSDIPTLFGLMGSENNLIHPNRRFSQLNVASACVSEWKAKF